MNGYFPNLISQKQTAPFPPLAAHAPEGSGASAGLRHGLAPPFCLAHAAPATRLRG